TRGGNPARACARLFIRRNTPAIRVFFHRPWVHNSRVLDARTKVSRRTVLRGAGVTMALPWLESVNAWSAPASFPKRFAVLFMGNGINGNHWWAKGCGADMKLSKSLA